ncbi:MAG: transposase [Candidatus Zixiibacteriota bacterium]
MVKRQFRVEEKFWILEEAGQSGTGVAEVCRRHQITSGLFYKWEADARKGAMEVLSGKRGKGKAEGREQQLQEKISRLRTVISEITEENLGLKKPLGD